MRRLFASFVLAAGWACTATQPPVAESPPAPATAVAAAATAEAPPIPAPTPTPSQATADPAPAGPGSCPQGMVLVEGEYCTEVEHQCLEHRYDESHENKVCDNFAPTSRCFRPPAPIRRSPQGHAGMANRKLHRYRPPEEVHHVHRWQPSLTHQAAATTTPKGAAPRGGDHRFVVDGERNTRADGHHLAAHRRRGLPRETG